MEATFVNHRLAKTASARTGLFVTARGVAVLVARARAASKPASFSLLGVVPSGFLCVYTICMCSLSHNKIHIILINNGVVMDRLCAIGKQ